MDEKKKTVEVKLIQEQFKKSILTREQLLFGITKLRPLDLSAKQGRQTLIDNYLNAIYLSITTMLTNGVPAGSRTRNYALGGRRYIHLTTETYQKKLRNRVVSCLEMFFTILPSAFSYGIPCDTRFR